jgi:membrane-associated protease RseP (regulator of RpoE activity)
MSHTSDHHPQPRSDEADAGAAPTPAAREANSRTRAVVMLAVVAAMTVYAVVTGSFAALAFVLALMASIMIHEAGHFVTAKWTGMKVTEFFLGFGPRLWSTRRGETEYGVKAIPAGGYVRITGMSSMEKGIDPAEEHRTYRQQSYPKKMLVAVAGIVTHFVMAFVILMLLWSVVGIPNPDRHTLEVGSISRLETGPSPAQDAGFRVGDRIVSIDGQPISAWNELPPYIRERPGRPITFQVEREGQLVTLTATPATSNPDGEPVGFVGIGSTPATERVNPVVAAGRSASDVGRITVASVQAIGQFFSPSSLRDYGDVLTGRGTGDELRPVSVVGVVRIADQAADNGILDFLLLFVGLNIFFAVFNAVPLPPFDGGHIAIATYERLRSRRGRRYEADGQKLIPLTVAVFVLMVTLGLTSVWLDIVDPLNNPFQ